MTSPSRPLLADRFAPFGTTIFTEMTLLAQKHGAVNLAQGFPDFDGPEFLKQAAAKALGLGSSGYNQYARMFGIPPLNAAIAAAFTARTGIPINPDTQVTVTSGCTEAICAALMGLINPGDEVILFEPYYDSYRASVAMAGGVPRFVTLHTPKEDCSTCTPLSGQGNFYFDPKELAAAFTPRTRAILVNTPHNPTGKVFTREELRLIAELCIRHDVIAITDEVYEHLTFDPALPHISLATLPGMADRTLTLSSLGKSFSLTGWKVGWGIGSPELSRALRAAHQFMTFATATPLQWGAVDACAMTPDAHAAIKSLVTDLSQARRFLAETLKRCGFQVHLPSGAYFIIAQWRDVIDKADNRKLGEKLEDDIAFCKWLTAEVGVAAIPPSVFYQNKSHGQPLARFAFCKKMDTLQSAADRLRKRF